MSVQLPINGDYFLEGANYITCINPMLHPDRILPYHDFLYILEGDWEIAEDDNVYQLHTDDLLILAAGRHHYGESPCSPGNRHMYIHAFPMQQPESRQAGETAAREFHSLIHCQNNAKVRQLFEEIISVMWSQDELKDIRLRLLMGLFLCEVYRQQDNEHSTRVNIAEQAANLIRTNPQNFYTCGDMAERFFVCERTINNLFRKAYGKSFYAYQMDGKLEMVRQYLLIHPESKLDEAARNFGFCDEFHLGKAYKKKYGISPRRHVRECLQPNQESSGAGPSSGS